MASEASKGVTDWVPSLDKVTLSWWRILASERAMQWCGGCGRLPDLAATRRSGLLAPRSRRPEFAKLAMGFRFVLITSFQEILFYPHDLLYSVWFIFRKYSFNLFDKFCLKYIWTYITSDIVDKQLFSRTWVARLQYMTGLSSLDDQMVIRLLNVAQKYPKLQ